MVLLSLNELTRNGDADEQLPLATGACLILMDGNDGSPTGTMKLLITSLWFISCVMSGAKNINCCFWRVLPAVELRGNYYNRKPAVAAEFTCVIADG